MSREQVREMLGAPDLSTDEKYGLIPRDNWLSGKHMLTVYYRDGRTFQIGLTSPRFKTADGISTQTSLARIKRKYKNIRERSWVDTKDDTKIIHYDSVENGIAFGRTAPDSPNRSYRFYSIVIHPPGVPLLLEGD